MLTIDGHLNKLKIIHEVHIQIYKTETKSNEVYFNGSWKLWDIEARAGLGNKKDENVKSTDNWSGWGHLEFA